MLVVLSTAVVACGGSTRTKTVTTSGAPAAGSGGRSLEQNYVSVISRVAPEVVQISTAQGLGSGVVFDKTGDVVPNAHVVAGGGSLQVTNSAGKTYSATLVGTFTPDDLAVVRAHGASLPTATFADSSSLKVGEIVLAVGNPIGLRSSVTNGIISALGRTVDEPDGAVLPNVIQTSAPINPGNSGGALVDLQGDIVGVPMLAASDPQLGGTAPGIGFTIPSSLVADIAGQIVKHGHVVNSHRAYLGIGLATGLNNGAVVAAVKPGGPGVAGRDHPRRCHPNDRRPPDRQPRRGFRHAGRAQARTDRRRRGDQAQRRAHHAAGQAGAVPGILLAAGAPAQKVGAYWSAREGRSAQTRSGH